MIQELSIGAFRDELIRDPDLRRLGEYKVVAGEGKTIIPIDIDFEGRSVHFGNGDFTDGFVAFAATKAESVDFGSSKFLDLYFDDLQADRLSFSEARASRLMFDYAKLRECRFNNFVAPEVYFDDAEIGAIEGDNLRAGIVRLERLNSPGFSQESLAANTHRLIDFEVTELAASETEQPAQAANEQKEVRVMTPNEFRRYLADNPDLSRLGEYRVVPEEGQRELHIDFEVETLNLGRGDLSELKVYFGQSTANLIDFSECKIDEVEFQDAKFRECFLADGQFRELRFGNASIENVYGEHASAETVHLDHLSCRQFNANEIKTRDLRMDEVRIGEMYFSRGEGVENMYFDQAELGLLNLHEGTTRQVHFGESRIGKALVNKAHIPELYVEGLRAQQFYIGNDGRNEIGRLEFEQVENISEINIHKAFAESDGRPVLHDVEGLASRVPRGEGDETHRHDPEDETHRPDPEIEQLFARLEADKPQGPEGESDGPEGGRGGEKRS